MSAAQHQVDQLQAAGRDVILDLEIALLASEIALELSTAVFRAALDSGLSWQQAETILATSSAPPARWSVYVLLNAAGVSYTGIAVDVERRLDQHNAGKGAKFTRGRGPWVVIHSEGPLDRPDALRREMAIKRDTAFKARLKRHAAARAAC